MEGLLHLPLVVPLASAVAGLLAWRHARIQRVASVIGSVALLVAAAALLAAVWDRGVIATTLGGWRAPLGITLVADVFAAVMVAVAALIGLVVVLYSLTTVDARREAFGYHPVVQVLMMGVCGAFLAGDLFNLYVWFEVMLIASFVLLALGGERPQLEGAIKYVTLNLLSSVTFLIGVGIVYGQVGTLNLADLSLRLRDGAPAGLVTTVAMLFLVAFGIKAAVFPFFFWLPASYHTPPAAVSALFAGLLTKVGVYSLIRVFTLVFVGEVEHTHTIILVIAALTMITGVMGAVIQEEFRRILSFHIISQIGYMVMGLGLFTPLALAGSIFYIVHHIIVKTALFLVSGVAYRIHGSYDLARLGGLAGWPLLAVLFLVPALSLAGLPPLSGFFAKLALVRAGLAAGEEWVIAVALVVSLLTLLSMSKIWSRCFWAPAPDGATAPPAPVRRELRSLVAPIAVLVAVTLSISLAAEGLFAVSWRAAEQLLDRGEYVRAVLR